MADPRCDVWNVCSARFDLENFSRTFDIDTDVHLQQKKIIFFDETHSGKRQRSQMSNCVQVCLNLPFKFSEDLNTGHLVNVLI